MYLVVLVLNRMRKVGFFFFFFFVRLYAPDVGGPNGGGKSWRKLRRWGKVGRIVETDNLKTEADKRYSKPLTYLTGNI